ncbi:hypothetical protein [Tolypothrix sp. VBCCA 56010]
MGYGDWKKNYYPLPIPNAHCPMPTNNLQLTTNNYYVINSMRSHLPII